MAATGTQKANWKKRPSPTENCFTGTRFDPKKIVATRQPRKPAQIGVGAIPLRTTAVLFPFAAEAKESAEKSAVKALRVENTMSVVLKKSLVFTSAILTAADDQSQIKFKCRSKAAKMRQGQARIDMRYRWNDYLFNSNPSHSCSAESAKSYALFKVDLR